MKIIVTLIAVVFSLQLTSQNYQLESFTSSSESLSQTSKKKDKKSATSTVQVEQECSSHVNFYTWLATNTGKKRVKVRFTSENGMKKTFWLKANATRRFTTNVKWGDEYVLSYNDQEELFQAIDSRCQIEGIELTSVCSDNPNKYAWRIMNPNDFKVSIEYEVYSGAKRKLHLRPSGKAKEKWEGHGDYSYTFFETNSSLGSTLKIYYGDDQEQVKASGKQACVLSEGMITATTNCDDVDGKKRRWRLESTYEGEIYVRINESDKFIKIGEDNDDHHSNHDTDEEDWFIETDGDYLLVEVYGGDTFHFTAQGCGPIEAPIYLSDAQSNGPTDIYAVHLNGENTEASLEYLFTVDHGAHIAVNTTGTIMYLVGHGNFHQYDLVHRQLTRIADLNFSNVTQAAVSPTGELWVVSSATDKAYHLNTGDGSIINEVTLAANPNGGDMVFTSSSSFLSADNELLAVDLSTGSTELLASLWDGITGMAVLDQGAGDILVSVKDENNLKVVNPANGDVLGTIPVFLNGAPFTLRYGDMATGILHQAFNPCQMFLADKETQKIYAVSIEETSVNTLEVFDFPYDEIHIALDPSGNRLYVVRKYDNNTYGYFDFSDMSFTEVGAFNAGAITQLSFAPSGSLYFSVNGSNTVHLVTDIDAGTHESLGQVKIDGTENYVNIKGADIAFDQDGSFYLATNNGGMVYTVSGLKDHLIAVPLYSSNKKITGLAIDDQGNLLASHYEANYMTYFDLNSYQSTRLSVTGDIQSTGWGDMTSACFELVDTCGGYASEVIAYNVGTLANGSGTPAAERMNPENALGEPQENDVVNFVSLGFGGELIVKLQSPVYNHNKNGVYVENENSINYGEKSMADLIIVETSYGRRETNCGPNMDKNYPEKIMVYGKQDLSDNEWVLLSSPEGECRSSFIDIQQAVDAGMSYIQYLKIVDITNPQHFSGSSDGFDVDGIIICPDEVAAAISGEGRNAIANARTEDSNTPYSEDFFNKAPDDIEQEQAIGVTSVVYPNPSNGTVTIYNTNQEAAVIINVYNLEGRKVLTSSLDAAKKGDFDLSGNEPGIYVVELRNGDHSAVQRIVLK